MTTRTEAQIRAEKARQARTVTVSVRLSPKEARLLDRSRGEASRQAYAKQALLSAITP
jgi:hypothetical protein